MENDYSFLKVFIQEPIYLIDDSGQQKITQQKPETKEEALRYIGENKKHIVILTEYSGKAFVKSTEFEQLLKILHAIKLSQHETAIVPYSKENMPAFDHVVNTLKPQTFLFFGMANAYQWKEATTLNIPFEQDGIRILLTDSLTVLLEDVKKKRALWEALQAMFLA